MALLTGKTTKGAALALQFRCQPCGWLPIVTIQDRNPRLAFWACRPCWPIVEFRFNNKRPLNKKIMSEPLRILSIGAHPADIFDQSGGTMAHHAARGDWVGCCVLTHGARIHDKIVAGDLFRRKSVPSKRPLARIISQRAENKADEVRRACALLGVKFLHFFGADDAVLLPNEKDVRRLARLLRKLRPEIVLTHFPYEDGGVWNPHAAAGQIVLLAIGLAASVDPGDRKPPHRVAQTFFWGQGANRVGHLIFHANRAYFNDVLVDITDVVDQKLACIDELVSQGYDGAYARKRIEASDGAFGCAATVAYAEGFVSLSAQVHRFLPLSDFSRKTAKETDHEIMARYSYRVGVGPVPKEPNKPETMSRKAIGVPPSRFKAKSKNSTRSRRI